MIKDIMCKLGYHKYRMTHRALTYSMLTRVICEVCGHELTSDSSGEAWEKKKAEILKKSAKTLKKFQK